LTLSENTASTDVMYCIFLGRAIQSTVPSTNSITAAMVSNDLISGKDALASEPADTDEFLVSDAGTLKRIDYSLIKGGGISTAGQWRLTTAFTGAANPIASNWEEVDTSYSRLGSAMSESSGVFTFPETGVYLVSFNTNHALNGDDRVISNYINYTTDNSTFAALGYADSFIQQTGSNTTYSSGAFQAFFDVTNTSTHKVNFQIAVANSSTQTQGSSTINATYVTFIRLGDT